MKRVSVISRVGAEHLRERRGDLFRVMKNPSATLHPFEREREYVRALNATKLDKVFAKPFVSAMSGHFDGVSAMCRHPTAISQLVSGDFSGELRLWSLASHLCVGRVQAHAAMVRGICFSSAEGRPSPLTLLTASDDRTVKLWQYPFDLSEDQQPIATLYSDHGITGIDHARYGNTFATSGGSRVELWDEGRSEPLHAFEWGTETVHSVRYNQVESQVLASCAGDRSVALYDVRGPKQMHKVILAMKANSVSWNPMEAYNFVAASDDGNLYSFDMRRLSKALLVHEDHVSAVMDVDFAPTGREFASGSFDHTLRIFRFDEPRSREVYHTKRMQRIFCVRFSGDARFVMSGSDDANVRVWKAQASAPLKILSHREQESLEYKEKLKSKFSQVPEIRRIAKFRRVPKAILSTKKRRAVMMSSELRRKENVRRHTRPEALKFVSKTESAVVEEVD